LIVSHIYAECENAYITGRNLYTKFFPATAKCRCADIKPTRSDRVKIGVYSFDHSHVTFTRSRSGFQASMGE